MRGVVFAPMHNTGRRKDATGAFLPEATAFGELHGLRLVLVDNHQGKLVQRARVLDEIRSAPGPLECVAFFCHGYSRGIQLGFDLGTVEKLAEAIAQHSTRDVRVPLYCCSTASTTRQLLRLGQGPGGDGGFADRLRDGLCAYGATRCVVDAHVTVGHTTKNPHVRRFSGDENALGGVGGAYLVERKPRATWRAWVRALRSGDLRFRFPWLSADEVRASI